MVPDFGNNCFSSSSADFGIVPVQVQVAGSGNTAGPVTVSLDKASSVTVGSSSAASGSGMSAGVVAVSSTSWLFAPIGGAPQGTVSVGNGGAVTVGNAGNIAATGASAFGVVGDASLSATKQIGPWSLGGSLAYAQGWFDNTRTLQLGAAGVAASLTARHESNSGMQMLGARLRGAYRFGAERNYVKP